MVSPQKTSGHRADAAESGDTSSSRALQQKIEALERQLEQLGENYAEIVRECERLRQEAAVSPLARRIRQSCNLNELLATFGEQVFGMPRVDGCAVFLINTTGDSLVTAYLKMHEHLAGIEKAYRGFCHHLDHPDVNVEVVRQGRPIVVTRENHADFGETTRLRFVGMAMRSLVVVPLVVDHDDGRTEIIGAVSAFSHEVVLDRSLADRIATLSALFAPQILVHWRHHQIVEWGETVKAMYAEIKQHIAFITEMNSVAAVEEVYALIGRRFLQRFGFDFVGILLADENTLSIEHVDFSPPFAHLKARYEPFRAITRYSLGVPDGSSSVVFANNQRFLFDDVAQIARLPMTDKDRESLALLATLRTFLLVPIRLNQAAIGVLWLGTLDQPIEIPDADLALIELLASFVSTAIRNAQAHGLVATQKNKIELLNRDLQRKVAQLDRVAHRDKLTGLNNFGSFEDELKLRVGEHHQQRDNPPLSVILFDVDHFKNFNDSFGHPAGNQVLQEVAARIQKCVRDVDFVARYGGEEFIVLLPQCDLPGAERIAERIRCKMADETFVVDAREHRITVSGGCAQLAWRESAADFVRRADTALYAAKQNGRDRIETAANAT